MKKFFNIKNIFVFFIFTVLFFFTICLFYYFFDFKNNILFSILFSLIILLIFFFGSYLFFLLFKNDNKINPTNFRFVVFIIYFFFLSFFSVLFFTIVKQNYEVIPENLIERNNDGKITKINIHHNENKYNTFQIPNWCSGFELSNNEKLCDILPNSIVNLKFSINDNKLIDIQDNLFEDCIYLKCDIIIPKNVNSIGKKAFAGCINCTSIRFSYYSSLTSIGEEAFYGFGETINYNWNCNILFPNKLTTIGNRAFYNCFYQNNYINDVIFSNYLLINNWGDNIFENVFYNSEKKINVFFNNLNSSISTVPSDLFSNINILKNIYIPKSEWNNREFYATHFNIDINYFKYF